MFEDEQWDSSRYKKNIKRDKVFMVLTGLNKELIRFEDVY